MNAYRKLSTKTIDGSLYIKKDDIIELISIISNEPNLSLMDRKEILNDIILVIKKQKEKK